MQRNRRKVALGDKAGVRGEWKSGRGLGGVLESGCGTWESGYGLGDTEDQIVKVGLSGFEVPRGN